MSTTELSCLKTTRSSVSGESQLFFLFPPLASVPALGETGIATHSPPALFERLNFPTPTRITLWFGL